MKEKTICSVDWCDRESKTKGFCNGHYIRFTKDQDMNKPWRKDFIKKICSVEWCEREHRALGFCHAHWVRFKKGIDLNLPWGEAPYNRGNTATTLLSDQGYVIYTKIHPLNNTGAPIKAHRLIYSIFLGRDLLENENVHHINAIRDDNRIENLELWTTSQPAGGRVIDKINWAKEILEKYQDFEEPLREV